MGTSEFNFTKQKLSVDDFFLVDESHHYVLYEKPKKSGEWIGFIIDLKLPKTNKTRFHIGWNGTRLAANNDSAMLASIDSKALDWLLDTLKREYSIIDPEIEKASNNLCIPYLVHFTNEKNLESILKVGLRPRGDAAKHGFSPSLNDSMRLDGHINATSLSIGFPNYKMFYKYRCLSPQERWAVIVIDRSVMWTKNCAFCKHNAADSRISSKNIYEMSSSESLLRMYEDLPSPYSRKEQKLHQYDPTDVQAEVLVFGAIPQNMFIEIVFNSPDMLEKYSTLANGVQLSYKKDGSGFFAAREFAR